MIRKGKWKEGTTGREVKGSERTGKEGGSTLPRCGGIFAWLGCFCFCASPLVYTSYLQYFYIQSTVRRLGLTAGG
jgi:hypothetical protein